ncbi:MAG: prolipoprotein diacylglyceryl transferase family protein [Candidatus Methylomirabilales bacterium]
MYPVLLQLGGFQLRAYGVVIAAALVLGTWIACQEAERKGICTWASIRPSSTKWR